MKSARGYFFYTETRN